MDLRSYFGPLRRKLPLILLTALLTAGVAWFVSSRAATSYDGQLYVTVSYADSQDTPEYKFGNFYANNAAIEFARTASGWLQSNRVVDEIYADAGLDLAEDVGLFGRLFGPISMKRVERANLLMGFSAGSQEKADRLLASLRENFSAMLISYNAASSTRYTLVNPSGRVEANEPNPPLAAALGLLAGLVLGVLLAYAVEYGSGTIIAPEQLQRAAGREPDFVLRASDPSLPEVLAAHLARTGGTSVLLGVSLDPSELAVRVAQRLRHVWGKVTLVEGEQALALSRRTGASGRGWSDEAPAAKGPVKFPAKLLQPVSQDVAVAPYGRGAYVSFARALPASNAIGVLSFPRSARQLVELPAGTPVLVVARLGQTRQRDLRHLARFLGDTPHAYVLLS